MFETLKGQTLPKELLTQSLKKSNLSIPFLFYGPSQVGKFYAAKLLARFVNCEGTKEDFCSCNFCSRIRAGDFLDYLELVPDEKQRISIVRVREALKFFSYKPREKKWKVLIIKRADLLTWDGSDILLKLLEEPYNQTLIVLTTRSLSAVRDTVVSRCCRVRFSYLDLESLKDLTSGQVAPIQLYMMGGSFKPVVASADLFYLRRAFREEMEDPKVDEVSREALEAEFLNLAGQLSYASRGGRIEVGRLAFQFADAERISEITWVIENGVHLLRQGVRPYLAMKSVESSIIQITR